MSVRNRTRLQRSPISWQDNRFMSDQRQQLTDIRRARMTCAPSLPAFRQTQDWTGGMSVSPSGRFQVIEEKKPKQRILSSEGVRWDAAVTALILAGVLMAAILLADLAGIGTGGRTLEKLSGKIESLENRNGQLREELVLNTGNASVCTEAVKMDLISSNGARTIRLTAPGNARLTLSTASAAAENEELAGRMISYAGD